MDPSDCNRAPLSWLARWKAVYKMILNQWVPKRQVTSRPEERLLVSQEGLCSMGRYTCQYVLILFILLLSTL
jgi:hypothetical protein